MNIPKPALLFRVDEPRIGYEFMPLDTQVLKERRPDFRIPHVQEMTATRPPSWVANVPGFCTHVPTSVGGSWVTPETRHILTWDFIVCHHTGNFIATVPREIEEPTFNAW